MQQQHSRSPGTLMVVLAFATVYLVWGSTYFFIKEALQGFPPFLLGAIRFIIAGLLLLGWSILKGEKVFDTKLMRHAAVGGILMLFIGNGMVIWVEQKLPSAMAAIMVSSAPLWFVLLDKPKWQTNFKSVNTIIGLVLGFAGVILLFGERIINSFTSITGHDEIVGLALLNIGVIAWAGGSLYTKYYASGGSAIVNTAWQILFAGLSFIPGVFLLGELKDFHWQHVPQSAWLSLIYLVIMGSIAGFTAYVWLLQVRPATQVSTYAYVNPVVAVLLGTLFAHEKITLLPLTGLTIILISVLLINISAYRKKNNSDKQKLILNNKS
jgi:drug/metabolite transporter (DMT)-like permease